MTTPPRTDSPTTRRGILQAAAAAAAVGTLAGAPAPASAAAKANASSGRLKQSVCRWCYGKIPLEDLCVAAKGMGLVGIDLLGPSDFATVKKHGLICTMVNSHPLSDGLCDPKYRDSALKAMSAAIEATSREGWRNVICFSGNARGIDRRKGMDNCVAALKEIVPVAEKANVILNMELLNSKVDHHDYMCDNSTWGVELVKRVGSDHFKLLYDIYHMQIMEGDVIRTIERDHAAFGHYHTGGNPGRHEIDDSQELNYKAIARAIADLKFDGFYAHEFIPVRQPLASLAEAVELCTV
ncbi:Hydroxypyruvate isomerase [Aquisphaera giovannonii]|uniref:Hydroxypyruvate isomerase n=1 Tax=Aquisphaera giovannonii TaxID=406548 RepID=A0A5B9WAZ1_9BACT|nr:sugar phosphate isomerase/epimerase family protein [Aquisphaera giovannonii]QEH37693.1 Hydroxypyruvate isomerase [Aquisphaera giovannonii]